VDSSWHRRWCIQTNETGLAGCATTAELTKMAERVRHDLESVHNCNFLVALKTVFPTILGAKKSQNAC
jgi:lipopolysaccharide/colanic/teichoic acid biosynthesis glycosyltransferase